MPVARCKADIMCLAVYTMAGGNALRGFMVQTVADRLGIDFEQAEAMTIAAAKVAPGRAIRPRGDAGAGGSRCRRPLAVLLPFAHLSKLEARETNIARADLSSETYRSIPLYASDQFTRRGRTASTT
jgi:hypothetical protein